MASNGRGRNRRRGAGERRGLGIGWSLFSILMVAAICAMGVYGWKLLRAGDAIATTQTDAIAEQQQAQPDADATEAPDSTNAPEAKDVSQSQTSTPDQPQETAAAQPESDSNAEDEEDSAMVSSAEWPAQQFPGITPYPSASYTTYVDGSQADILLPAGGDSGFKDYAAQLVHNGASIYLDNARLTVLATGDTEIQLVYSADSPSISLCAEPAISFEDTGDVLPQSGRLVSSEPGEDALGLVLTYRCVSLSGLMDYLDLLKREGWTSSDQASPVDGTYYATYQRGDRIITIDYYVNSSNFQIFLGTKVVQ